MQLLVEQGAGQLLEPDSVLEQLARRGQGLAEELVAAAWP